MEEKEIFLKALDLDKKGDWDGAHKTVQDHFTPEACWIHAYLHRKEGDIGNSHYWYSRAGKSVRKCSFEEEWNEIREHLNS